jgi:hypothetical protein
MSTTARRTIAALATLSFAVINLAACSDASPTAASSTAQLSRGGSASDNSNNGNNNGAKAAVTKLEIALIRPTVAAFPRAEGKAKFEAKGTEKELQVEVEHVPAGTALIVLADGVTIGNITANALGEAELHLNTTHGDTVPVIVAGSIVSVTTTAGAVVVSGTF